MKIEKKTLFPVLFLIIASVITMTVVSASSPIYPLNVWDDANVYFTVGRGIIHGDVPYRDLYEQKGPIFLFMYALASLVSNTSFTGVWVFECIAASIFSIVCWKQVKLFVKDVPAFAIGLVPVFTGIIYTIGMFNFGGNTEEFCFPLLSVVFYIALKAIHDKQIPGMKDALITGVISGLLFWTKYTFLGFIAAFILLLIIKAFKAKKLPLLGKDIAAFFLGFVVVSLPVFVYFGVNNALDSLWESYFYNNIFNYITHVEYQGIYSIAAVRFVVIPLIALKDTCMMNLDFTVLFILSIFGIAFFDKKYRKDVIVLAAVTFPIALKAVFTQNFYTYYYGYILVFYFIFALIFVSKGIVALLKKMKDKARTVKLFSIIVCAIVFVNILLLCKNTYLLTVPREDLAQYKFAEIINETEDPKVLTYDIIDGGFYLAAGISPSNRYFTTMNFIENNTEACEEQNRLISEGYFDYIVTYSDEYDWDNYEIVARDEDPYCDFTKILYTDGHCLYRRVSD